MVFFSAGCHDETGGWACCSSSSTCNIGEGDCDAHTDCKGLLHCGVDNCDMNLGFPTGYDCCIEQPGL